MSIPETSILSEQEEHILRAIQSIPYGSVTITIHNARITQIEKNEKIRFDVKN